MAHHPNFSRDFSVAVRNSLTRKGIAIIGLQAIPGHGDMPWANSERGYCLDDNGTHRIRTRTEVISMAG